MNYLQGLDLFAQSLFKLDQGRHTIHWGEDAVEIYAEWLPNRQKQGELTTLKIWGRIKEGFHIYSINVQGDYAPEPTHVLIDSEQVVAVSHTRESETVSVFDEAFDQRLAVHRQDFWLEQSFRIRQEALPGPYFVRGELIFQICNKRICSLPVSKPLSSELTVLD